MSQAFDRLPRDWLMHGFDLTQVPYELSQLFMLWLQDASIISITEAHRLPFQVPGVCGKGAKPRPLWDSFPGRSLKRLEDTMPGTAI